jgi:hypothetical protein
MSHLRHLSVFVDEPEPGLFFWVLHESTGDPTVWVDIGSGESVFNSWMDAFEAGCVELFKLVTDERLGPRAPDEDENAAPIAGS